MITRFPMTRSDQKDFITDIIENVKSEILQKFDRIPPDWTGVELRWYIAEKFSEIVRSGFAYQDKRNQYYRKYKNDTLINNL